MTYDLALYENYLKKVNEFKKIGWVQNYIELKKKPNFWTILEYGQVASSRQKSSHEIRYSKMVRWLLDANENHNLGNTFASKLLQLSDSSFDYQHHLSLNKNIKCDTEALENIDIFYTDMDQKIVVAIELKQFTTEHDSTGYDSQLDKYEDSVQRFIKQKKQAIKPIYIYLTPLKENPSNENWIALGYEDLITIIEEVGTEYLHSSDDPNKVDIQKIIYDFRDDLQRTIDILVRDVRYVRDNFTKEEIKLTQLLAQEVFHQEETKHLDKLIELDRNINVDIKELILLLNEYNYTQDHTPNNGVRLLMRKIYNYLSEGPSLDLDLNKNPSSEERISGINANLIEENTLNFDQIELTRGKGQGIKLHTKEKDKFLYFSGDKEGHFPNDSMSIGTATTQMIKSKNIKNKMFQVDYDLIQKDQIIVKANKESSETINLESFIKDYIISEIKVLNNHLNE